MTATCTDCTAPLGRSIFSFSNKNDHPCDNNTGTDSQCQARLCKDCVLKHPLIQPPASGKDDPVAGTLKHYCKACFQKESTIDFSKEYETVEGSGGVVWVFAHGASASRQMFVPHAKELKERFGHSSILLDLPGHASQLETPLSLESSKTLLEKVLKECEALTKDKKLIYVGGSLGAYVGFYLLDQCKDQFSGAVLMDCGQNVGPGASFKATVGLVVLKWIGRNFSNAAMMQLMLGEVKKSPADYHLIETVFGAGMFFEQAEAHVQCLKTVAPADYIPNLPFPILYMNGTEDYRDSENKWLDLCVKKEDSELKVYEGGDHFFMYDKRFVEDILTRMESYSKKL
jgi:pimeloyl-ACP methyl ester carboxylesterase